MNVQDGETALYIACGNGHLPVVRLLLQKHANVSICSKVYHSSVCTRLSMYCVCSTTVYSAPTPIPVAIDSGPHTDPHITQYTVEGGV